jgi:hypothetical protein
MSTDTDTDFDQIDDPGEYNQRRRVRAINNARERVFEQRRRGLDMLHHNRISEFTYKTILREAVETLIMEVEDQLQNFDADSEGDGQEHGPQYYWEDVELGSVSIPPNGDQYHFTGLESILEFDDPLVVSWVEHTEPPAGFSTHPEGQTEQRRERIQIPSDVLMSGARETMAFLDNIGLGLHLQDETPQDKASHSDLRGLVQLRGQDEVAEQLPGDDDG